MMHVIIFIWGFTGILGKLIHLDAIVIVWYRVIIAPVFLALFFVFTNRSLKIELKHLWKIAIVGVIVASHWLTFYYSIQLSTASLGVLCLSTTTLHVTWLEPIVMRRRFSWLEFGMGAIVIFGIYFISGDFNPQETQAMYFGLSSALCAALFSVFNAKLSEDIPSTQMTFYELIVGFIFVSLFLVWQEKMDSSIFTMTWSDIAWLLFLGIVCTSFAFLVMIEIVKKLGAFTASLSINLEPVYTILLAIVILNEHELLNLKFYIGSFIIILVVLLNGIVKHHQKKRMIANLN
jgi:drug/metabolite transporter (DMT)-like permease